MWRPSTSFLLRPAPICSTSVIFLLGRCFLLGAFRVLLSDRAFFRPDFQGILDCWSQLPDLVSLSATAVSHFSCALLPCQPFPDEWSLLSLPETRAYAAGASTFFAWTNPAGRPTAVQLRSLLIPLLGRLQVFACLLGLFPTLAPITLACPDTDVSPGDKDWNLTIPRCR